MKQLFQFLLLAGIVFTMIACQDSPKTDSKTTSDVEETKITMADLSVRKLNADSARVWIQRWKDNSAQYMSNHSIEYFDMPMADLRAVTSQHNVDQARYYIGLEEKATSNANRNFKFNPHLILVGLKDDNVADLDKAYDYTHVCPPLCDLFPPNPPAKK